MQPLLDVSDLTVSFSAQGRSVTALHQVSFSLMPGKTLALVGESGSGKSVTSLAIMGLLPANAMVGGAIHFSRSANHAVELTKLAPPAYRLLRGEEIAMIFQEPMSSLNPLFTIGDQIGEMLLLHSELDAGERRRRVLDMLELVEIPGASSRIDSYPHELSGGMRQRVMIALALVCNPTLLIADEPTTALDVTIQAQILDLMRRLQAELGMSILFITHDMGVVAEMADDVAVMYAGSVVEEAPVKSLFAAPVHPYTKGLLASIPVRGRGRSERLVPIAGTVPALHNMPPGCAFATRCPNADTSCEKPVERYVMPDGRAVACIHAMPLKRDVATIHAANEHEDRPH
ncbi:MAG: ABC transporter ATP-binding protein [Granulosicoccus sp.]